MKEKVTELFSQKTTFDRVDQSTHTQMKPRIGHVHVQIDTRFSFFRQLSGRSVQLSGRSCFVFLFFYFSVHTGAWENCQDPWKVLSVDTGETARRRNQLLLLENEKKCTQAKIEK
jgi:hypothetical protein